MPTARTDAAFTARGSKSTSTGTTEGLTGLPSALLAVLTIDGLSERAASGLTGRTTAGVIGRSAERTTQRFGEDLTARTTAWPARRTGADLTQRTATGFSGRGTLRLTGRTIRRSTRRLIKTLTGHTTAGLTSRKTDGDRDDDNTVVFVCALLFGAIGCGFLVLLAVREFYAVRRRGLVFPFCRFRDRCLRCCRRCFFNKFEASAIRRLANSALKCGLILTVTQ
jgi:hypothetical protein